jgi:hypothetical protein
MSEENSIGIGPEVPTPGINMTMTEEPAIEEPTSVVEEPAIKEPATVKRTTGKKGKNGKKKGTKKKKWRTYKCICRTKRRKTRRQAVAPVS